MKQTSFIQNHFLRQVLPINYLPYFFLFFLFVPDLGAQTEDTPDPEAKFVWASDGAYERFQVAYFRTSIQLEEMAGEARLSLFADSRYHLIVNGQFINFGPARSYPRHPEYDTYDLLPYLKKGENVIAVKVFSNGTANFQLRNGPPALIAWGSIKSPSGVFHLSTPGKWRVYPSNAFDAFAPRMNFALGPMEVYDAGKDQAVKGWDQTGYRENGLWSTPGPVAQQEYWGTFERRSIPPLTQQEYQPFRLLGVYTWKDDETLYNFQLTKKDRSWDDFRGAATFLAYTYISSPKEQEVEAGLWWGEHFLNGEGPLSQTVAGPEQPHRQQATLKLQKGWNYFFIRRHAHFGKWAFQLAVRRSAGLVLSPERKMEGDAFFRTTGPFYDKEEEMVKTLDLAKKDLHRELNFAWKDQTDPKSGNPALDMGWRYVDQAIPLPEWQLENIEIPAGENMSLVYDFRYKKLGRISIEYEAPEGTILDIGFTEDLVGRQAHVMKRVGLYMATRHICGGGSTSMETLRPYGMRYLQINVSNHHGPVKIKKVRVINQIYPFEELGSFSCSDPLMNKIWAMGWRTLRVCAEDSYTDTPFRERGLYAGDMLPQMGVTLAGSGDLRLVRRSIALFQEMYADLYYENRKKHPDEIDLLEDYPLLALEALSWYVDRTGDVAFAEELFPNYEKLLKDVLNKRNELGLIHNERVFIEWTRIQKSDLINTAYQAILARSCLLMARLAKKVGRGDRSSFYQLAFQELSESIRNHLWDDEKQAFSDGIQADTLISHHFPISSVWPFLAGITDTDQNEQIFPYIAEELKDIGTISRRKKTTPYGSFYVLQSLYENDLAGAAEDFIRKHWGEMVYKNDDTTWENFDDTGVGTLSHAWSASPTFHLTTKILGVDLGWPHPSDPDQLVIAPQTSSVSWATGKVPHPKGVVQVSWEVRGNLLWVDCQVPEGIAWSVQPKGRLAQLELWVNGEKK